MIVGTLDRGADPGDLIRYGTPASLLLVTGALLSAAGLWLWNGLGPRFGLGPRAQPPDGRISAGTFLVLVLLIAAELLAQGHLYRLD